MTCTGHNLNAAVGDAVGAALDRNPQRCGEPTLGSSVHLASGYPTEGYYRANASNQMQLVGSVTSTEPTLCCRQLQIQLTFAYAPMFGITVMGVSGITCIIYQQYKLDASELAMGAAQMQQLITCRRAGAAVEFAFMLPALAMLVVGTFSAGLVMYSISGLHSAVEAAARCFKGRARGRKAHHRETDQLKRGAVVGGAGF